MLIKGNTTQRLEEEARERLFSKPRTALNDLFERWKCRSKACKNYDLHCWVDVAENKHYPFDSGDASRWVKSIPEHASLERPSDRLRAQLVCKAASKGRNSSVHSTGSTNGGTVNHFNITLPTPIGRYMDRYAATMQSPPGRRHSAHMPSSSPARSEADWRSETERYFEYLVNKFPGDKEKLLAAKQILLSNDVDLKSYKDIEPETFEKWDITWGIAKKICRDVKIFQMEDIY